MTVGAWRAGLTECHPGRSGRALARPRRAGTQGQRCKRGRLTQLEGGDTEDATEIYGTDIAAIHARRLEHRGEPVRLRQRGRSRVRLRDVEEHLTAAFAETAETPVEDLGLHALRGLPGRERVLIPARTPGTAQADG